MSIGIFMLVKNEEFFIGPWLKHLLPYVDEFVLYDGNSTDGTLPIVNYCQEKYDPQKRIKLFKDKDPEDLRDDYVRYFNGAMRQLTTDWAWFIHPDMHVANPWKINTAKLQEGVAQSCRMRSFAGNMDDVWFEIKGRAESWKNIYRLHNPDLGAHYHGHYGASNEDVYFAALTGEKHNFYGENFGQYPYAVHDSGLDVLHFSDVRTYARRLGRMKACLKNQGFPEADIDEMARNHPRVSLAANDAFDFIPAQGKDFDVYMRMREEFDQFLTKKVVKSG